jgi:hypothetical protein
MRPSLFAGAASGYTPTNFKPYQSRLPNSTAARLDGRVHPVPNPTNPGYAYGTMIPLAAKGVGMIRFQNPRTIPVGKTFSNQVPMKPQIQGVTMDPTRGARIAGSIATITGADHSGDDAYQAKLSQARR